MNSSSDTAGFQIIGARKQLYVVPPWHTHHTSEESCTVLYLVSSPLPSDVSSVVFNITTRNQGWHSNPRDGIWSWFEVSILSSWQQNAMPKLDDLMKPTYVQPCPDDFGEYLQEQGLYFKEIPSKIAASSSGISISLSDTSMRRSWVEMVHIYGKDDNAKGGSFLPILEEGDRLVIWARTKTPKRDEPDRSSQQQDEQISHLESVLSHMCSDDSRKPDVLSSLGFGYMFRYKRSSKKEDIEKSLDLHRLAMEQEPENREFRARFVLALLDRYSGFHDSADIDLAIVELEKTIPLPLDFPQRQGYLESFANAYRSRHRDTGNEGDIQRLIQLYKEIETTFPDDSVEKAIYTGQRMKYDETVSIEERDIALRQMEDALIPTPAHLQQYQVLLRLLSKQYYARWELTGDSKDLELAISKAKDHVSALPENDVSVSSAAVYEFLGHLLRKKGLRSENTAELMAACEQMEKALDAAPPNSIYRDLMVIKRAEYLAMLPFESKRREALLRTAVEKCDYLHTTWFNRLSNPAKSSLLMFISWHYYNLYVFTKHPADLEQALQYVEGKSDLESIEGGVDKTLLRWKGEMWLVKANETRVTDGTATRRGMQYLLQSSASDSSLPRERVLSAESIIRRANRTGSWELASKAADQIFPLLPLITSRDLSNEDKIYTLQDISTIASNACAAILMFRPPMEALLKLEVGRGIVMGDLINNSSDLSGLHQAHPDLAQEYERLRLQAFHSLKHEKWETGQTQLLNERRIVFQQLQQCERQIRAKAGFEGFLHPMNIRQMVDCAREGPIIVVNITCTSSDAIFVLSPTIIGHHRLNSMITRAVDKFREYLMRHAMTELYGDPWSYEKDPGARDLDSDLPREAYDNNLLSWLWYTCVKPILTSLASDGHISSGEEKSRVWWIGTGAAAGLPFHAAGDYSQSQENKGESCLDHVISSYTPTIKALHAVRAKAAAQQASRRVKERPSLLVATMPDTPGYGALHGVRREAQGISDAVGQSMEVKQLISPSTDEVLSQLQDCDLVHFACHGHSDPGNPANSHLLLQKHSDTGMVVDKLTVSKLLDTQTISRAWIAYLSACSTAEIRDRRLLDEGLHITSGFLMAGFTHVIGSLWPAEDEVCVHMATYFYKALITRYATATDLNRAVAEAVHDATLQIRRQYWHSPLSWALYTHVGA
ncbi:hypothetical protein AnigIFM59636_006280 [Aspergillus niger]|nr:hypothetical protein AnigIFM59636_006280 [Aspergillus niger]